MESKSKKYNFLEWYKSIIFDHELLKYYDVSGCYVILPRTYKMWEHIQNFLDKHFKSIGVDNVYFPLLISETNLSKESTHLEGFTPEVAWVTQTGNSPLNYKLAIRPTSECAIYPTLSEIIKSHIDLPLKWNQWCSVVRWEFNDPTPFIRSREFLWNEGHCAFSTKEEACENTLEMLEIYRKLYEDILRIPVIPGKKTTGEKFAGADDTYTLETYISDAGKAIQCATSHYLGQNFSKIFNIKYQIDGQDGHNDHVWQTSWGLTTRSIGTSIMTHGDDKGLVFPSTISEYQIIIVPIFKKNNFDKINEFCKAIENHYKQLLLRVHYDISDRRPGWKYNYWEAKGIPLRFEIGEREVDNASIICYCRSDNISKKTKHCAFMNDIEIYKLLSNYDENLFNKAKDQLNTAMVPIEKLSDIEDHINNNNHRLYFGSLCDNIECEKGIKQLKVKPLCRPLVQQYFIVRLSDISSWNKCLVCKNEIDKDSICLFSKSF